MNKKLVFRILGALSSALIVVSVFVPFISVEGYSQSIWQSNSILNTLYLPIMIIIFGIMGIIFFALNIKTEFAYMSSGAILFFVVMRTVDIINQNSFGTLGIGYYFAAIGSIMVGVMAFLCNLRSVKLQDNNMKNENNNNEYSYNKIESSYDDKIVPSNNLQPIQPLENMNLIEPIPDNGIPNQNSLSPELNSIPNEDLTNNQIQEPISNIQQSQVQPEIISENQMINNMESQIQPVNPVIDQAQNMQPVNPAIDQEQNIQPVNSVVDQVQNIQPVNPAIDQVQSIQPLNPMIDQEQNIQPINQQPIQNVNPVIQDFINPVELNNTSTLKTDQNSVNVFPLDQENIIPIPESNQNPSTQQFISTPIQEPVDINPNSMSNVPNTTNSGVDIFGQPINK